MNTKIEMRIQHWIVLPLEFHRISGINAKHRAHLYKRNSVFTNKKMKEKMFCAFFFASFRGVPMCICFLLVEFKTEVTGTQRTPKLNKMRNI